MLIMLIMIVMKTINHENDEIIDNSNNDNSQCGLITKSDAERLCSHLLDKSPPR